MAPGPGILSPRHTGPPLEPRSSDSGGITESGPPGTTSLSAYSALPERNVQQPGERIFISGDLGGSGRGRPGRPGRQGAHTSRLTEAQAQARQWLPQNAVMGALMSAALAIVHPEQYALTRECLIRLARKNPHFDSLLRIWPFAFTSVAAVSNRSAGGHRDRRSGEFRLIDLMATIGGDRDVLIEFEGLGFIGRYDSGSMVAMSCHTHLHSVSESPEAERLAFAAFMKPSVLLDMGLDFPRAPTLDSINALHMEEITALRLQPQST